MSAEAAYRLRQSLGYQMSVTTGWRDRHLDVGQKALGLTRATWCILLATICGDEPVTLPRL